VFSWPQGSKHTLDIAAWQFTPSLPKGRYIFQHWSTALGQLASPSNVVTVTADAGIPWYRADLTTEYTVSLVFFQCDGGSCAFPGTIWVNQVAYQQSTDVWLAAGTTVTLEASPNPGFVFDGWTQGGSQAAIYSFVLNTAIAVYPRFAVARSIQLLTSPDGLQLLADRGLVSSPVTLDWGFGTAHTLAPISPQFDQQGRQWVFRSWSDGGDKSHIYQVPTGSAPIAIVAQFVPAVPTVMSTDPVGLTLTVDGQDGAAPRFNAWGPGETHTVTAPLHQIDTAGAPWSFREWSGGPASTQTIQVTDAQVGTGIRMTASYDPLSRIRLESSPSGLALSVDGADCHTPCEVERAVGTTVRISGPASIPVSDGVRLDFSSWEGVATATFAAAAGYHKLTAHYQWSYRLALSASPAQGGSWRLTPAASDGFFPAGSSVSIGIDAASGMKFREWGQDLSGSVNPMSLTMNGAHSVVAFFDSLPKAPTAPRIGNSAGDTPAAAVAAGSIASLFGDHLADASAIGTTDPLPQSLAGVSLVCSGRLLPLLYVSPQQINFQVPGNLQPGSYQVELHNGSGPIIQVKFDLTRNAPGIFVATHVDGSAITVDSPVGGGETIMIYGTGLGPYQPMPFDGFKASAVPPSILVDSVEIVVQGRDLAVDTAIAAAGAVGVAMIAIRIPDDLDKSIPATVVVKVGGVVSNALPLPLQ